MRPCVERRSRGNFSVIICSCGFPALTAGLCCRCEGGGRRRELPRKYGFQVVGFIGIRCDYEIGPVRRGCVNGLTTTRRATRALVRSLRGNRGNSKKNDSRFFRASTAGFLTTYVCFFIGCNGGPCSRRNGRLSTRCDRSPRARRGHLANEICTGNYLKRVSGLMRPTC